jgi:uncharacterized DUF497 family protein
MVQCTWDPAKAASNFRKHGVRFAEAVTVLEDHAALTIADEGQGEDRFVTIGTGSFGRTITMVYTMRDDQVRIISARKATRQERTEYESRRK